VQDGSARVNTDYTFNTSSQILVFTPGINRQLIEIDIVNDTVGEHNETFSLQLEMNSNNSEITGRTSKTIKIIDDDSEF
jgi:hypothetical protein